MLSSLLIASLSIASVFASDCNVPANFPAPLVIGQSFPLVTQSATSSDALLNTTIKGSLTIRSTCSIQLTGLTLTNAPLSAQIQLYGTSATASYPISASILSGAFNNADGPIFTLSDLTVFQVSASSPGIAFSDFVLITVYSVQKSWVIATAVIRPGPIFSGSSAPAANTLPAGTTTIVPSGPNSNTNTTKTGANTYTVLPSGAANSKSSAKAVLVGGSASLLLTLICSFMI